MNTPNKYNIETKLMYLLMLLVGVVVGVVIDKQPCHVPSMDTCEKLFIGHNYLAEDDLA